MKVACELPLLVAIATDEPGYCTKEDAMDTYKPYYQQIVLPLPFEEARTKTVDALKAQGFGLLTEIDMRAKFKEKLDKDIPKYMILGVCAPDLAYRAWEQDPRVGVLLPCTVVVRAAEDGGSEVLIGDPASMALFSPGITEVLEEVQAKVAAVVAELQQ